MTKISQYDNDNSISKEDKVLGTDSEGNETKNYTYEAIIQFLKENGVSTEAQAYDIWLSLGNTGTEQDFLDTLVGPQGPPGPTGATGPAGSIPAKTSASITLSATTQVLPNDINSCSFSGGKAYLPTTTEIGKEVYVIATASNIEIQANVATTAKMFVTFNTFVTSVTLAQYDMYRFTYVGFGSGAGGATDGYWKAEPVDPSQIFPHKKYVALLTQSSTGNPVATVLENTLGGSVVWTRGAAGSYSGALTGAFDPAKTTCIMGPVADSFSALFVASANAISLRTRSFSWNGSNMVFSGADDLLSETTVEIRVYN